MPPNVIEATVVIDHDGLPFRQIATLSNGGYALAWEEDIPIRNTVAIQVFTAVYDNQGNLVSLRARSASGDVGRLGPQHGDAQSSLRIFLQMPCWVRAGSRDESCR